MSFIDFAKSGQHMLISQHKVVCVSRYELGTQKPMKLIGMIYQWSCCGVTLYGRRLTQKSVRVRITARLTIRGLRTAHIVETSNAEAHA